MTNLSNATRFRRDCIRGERRIMSVAFLLLAAALSAGCFGVSKKKTATPPPQAPTRASASVQAPTAAPSVATSTPAPAVSRPFTPVVSTPRPAPSPTPSPSTAIREENGLKIQDVEFVGRVSTTGGLRIRSAPDASASNVVGSVPEGALITVEGKVLNGAEAEQGKGTVWYIVGVKQYVYGAEGYVVPVGTPTPAPR